MVKVNYLIGIDYGEDVTTASCVELGNVNMHTSHLNILDSGLPDCQIADSCISMSHDGTWSLNHNHNSVKTYWFRRFVEGMISPAELDTYKLFIKKVFESIIVNNPFLIFNSETGERNFYLAVACPSRWTRNERLINESNNVTCLQFWQDIIPVDTMISASEAAYSYFLNGKHVSINDSTSLLINYEVSVIESTFIKIVNGIKHIHSEGSPLGAREVVRALFYYIEKNQTEQFNKAVSLFNTFVNNYHLSIDWKPIMWDYLAEMIWYFYHGFYSSENLPPMSMSLYDILHNYSAGNLVFFRYTDGISKQLFENEILKSYKSNLYQLFNQLAIDGSPNWIPNTILIYGTGYKMPWFKELIIEVFGKRSPGLVVEWGDDSSHVVSDGIIQIMRQSLL